MISSLVLLPSRGHQPIKTARSTTVNRKTCIRRHSALIGQPRHSRYAGSTCRDLSVSVVNGCSVPDSFKRAKLDSHNDRLWMADLEGGGLKQIQWRGRQRAGG